MEMKIKPLGKPLELSDADLDLLAQVTPEEIEAVRVWWIEIAPGRYRTILDAPLRDDAPPE